MAIYKRDILQEPSKAPDGCECEMVELPNQAMNSKVKGYTEAKTCAVCQAINEANAITSAAGMAKMKADQEKEALIQAKMREMAEAELKSEGKL